MEESGVASQDYGLWLRATSSSRSLPSRPRRDGHNETGRGAPRDVIALSPTLGTGQKMVSREERVVVNVVKALEAQPTVCKDLRGGVPGLATSRRTVDLGKAPTIAIMGVYGLAPALAGNISIRGKGVSSNSVEVCNDHTGSLPMKEFGDTFIFKSVAMKTGIEDSGSVTDGGGKPKAMELDRKFSKWKRCARERVNGSSKLSGSLMSLGKRSQSSFGVQDVETLKKARGLDVSGIQLALEASLSPFCCEPVAASICSKFHLRSANSLAYSLAKLALRLVSDCVLIEDIPNCVANLCLKGSSR
ncbi:hypothetical protein ACOSQ4_027626 [Xanthoceras sorbifolium]